MGKIKDITGVKFGRLTAIEVIGKYGTVNIWKCICECGNETNSIISNLTSGHVRSCGCLAKEVTSKRSTKHGEGGDNMSVEYKCLSSIRERCLNPKHKSYPRYGGRGIKVCDRWSGDNGFNNFLSDMGRRPSKNHSIDRYPNNDGDYEPINCRWGTKKQQSEGRSVVRWFEINGIRMTMYSWSKHFGISISALSTRIHKYSFEEAYDRYSKIDKIKFINHSFGHII